MIFFKPSIIFDFYSCSILNLLNISFWSLVHVIYWCSSGKFSATLWIVIFVSVESHLEFHIDLIHSWIEASWSKTCNNHFLIFYRMLQPGLTFHRIFQSQEDKTFIVHFGCEHMSSCSTSTGCRFIERRKMIFNTWSLQDSFL